MKIIAVTGGVATGKTTVAKNIASLLKTSVIDADKIVHELLVPGTKVYVKIVQTFGKSILKKGSFIDRKVLGEVVFGNVSRRKKLERIIHPAVKKEINGKLKDFRKKRLEWAVMDIPLLFEAKMESAADTVIVVVRSRDLQIKTLRKIKKISLKEARSRIDSQLPLSQKVRRADFVIDNNGSICDTKKQIKKIFLSIQNI